MTDGPNPRERGVLGLLRGVNLPSRYLHAPEPSQAGALATLLHVAGLLYCAEHLTDGALPRSAIPTLVDWSGVAAWRDDLGAYGLVDPYALARRLCEVSLWRRVGETHYAITGYLLDQASRAQVERALQRKRDYHARTRSATTNGTLDANSLQRAADFSDPLVTHSVRPGPEDGEGGRSLDFLMELPEPGAAGGSLPASRESASRPGTRHRDDGTQSLGAQGGSQGGRQTPLPPRPPTPREDRLEGSHTNDQDDVTMAPTLQGSPAVVNSLLVATPDQLRAADALRAEGLADATPPTRRKAPTRTPAPAAAPPPVTKPKGQARVKAFCDEVMRLDPDLYATGVDVGGRNAGAIAHSTIPPEYLARAYVDARHKRWGDEFMQRNMSAWYVVDRIDAYRMYVDGRRTDPLVDANDELGAHVRSHKTGG